MKTRKTSLVGIAVLSLAQFAGATELLEIVNAIVIEADQTDVPDQMVITGRNFDSGKEMQVTLGSTLLEVLEHTANVILAEIPVDIVPGDYELIVWSEAGSIREGSLHVTLGSHVAKESIELE